MAGYKCAPHHHHYYFFTLGINVPEEGLKKLEKMKRLGKSKIPYGHKRAYFHVELRTALKRWSNTEHLWNKKEVSRLSLYFSDSLLPIWVRRSLADAFEGCKSTKKIGSSLAAHYQVLNVLRAQAIGAARWACVKRQNHLTNGGFIYWDTLLNIRSR